MDVPARRGVPLRVPSDATLKPAGTWDLDNVDEDYEVIATHSPPIANSVLADGGAHLAGALR